MQSMRRCGPPLPPSPRVPGSCTRTRESGGGMHTCAWGGRGCMGFLRSLSTRSRPSVLYVVLRFLAPRRSLVPPDSFLPSHRLPSTLNRYPSLPFPSTLPSIHPLLSSGLDCCNLWPMPVDLTVELSHGDLYGLLILQRSSGGCGTWPWVFIDFQRATNYHHHQGG